MDQFERDREQAKIDQAVAVERARIRQELLEALDDWTREQPSPTRTIRDSAGRALATAIRRILPEEG